MTFRKSSVPAEPTVVPAAVVPSAWLTVTAIVPSEIVVAPVKVFVPERASVPAPVLERMIEAPPVPILPATLKSPPPEKVRVFVPPPISKRLPFNESVPESAVIELVVFKPMEPAISLAPETFRSAPPLLTPVPLIVSASAPTVMPPCSSSAAPDATVVPPPVVPSAVAFWMLSTPAETVVVPVYELAPVMVRVFAPAFVTEPDPLITNPLLQLVAELKVRACPPVAIAQVPLVALIVPTDTAVLRVAV